MKEFIEKLIGRLKEESCKAEKNMVASLSNSAANFYSGEAGAYNKTIAIVNQLAEEHKDDIQTIDVSELLGESVNDGWIACSERFPEERFFDDGYVEPSEAVLVLTKYNSYKVSRYWGNRRNKRDYHDWVDIEYRKNEVIAWKPIAPYQPKGE